MSQRDRDTGNRISQIEDAVQRFHDPPNPDLRLPVLRDRSERMFRILDAIRALFCEYDASGQVLYVSPQVESILGLDLANALEPEEIQFHPDDIPKVVATGKKVRETGEIANCEVRVRHKQGHWVWMETSLFAWAPTEDGEFHTVAIARDITALKSSEAARRESEARYRAVTQMSCDLILEVKADGQLTFIGPGSEDIIGYRPEDAIALAPWSRIHREDLPRIRMQVAEAFVEAADEALDAGPLPRPLRMMEYRVQHRDGRWLLFESFGRTYRKADGELRFLVVGRDVTEAKAAEAARSELEERMQQAQKLESLGVLAGGIAHDFNNLLTPILGAAGLGLADLPEDSPVRARLTTIQRAAKRAAALTSQMLAYAGQRPLRIEPIDVSRLVSEMRELVVSSISGKATMALDLATDLPSVQGEPAQLSQVVMNLITNAVESLPEGMGRISLRTGQMDVVAAPVGALFAETMATGRHVFIEISDTGCGMDEETRAKIFDPFYTTKFTGRGLGLAAVSGIVRSHRGAIEVSSAPGGGTLIRVYLPASEAPSALAASEQAAIGNWRATGTVLVIDDDEGVRDLASDVLRQAGMKVLTASDGHAGLKLFRLHAESIRVVLLDRTMPTLSGSDTFEAIRELRPDARIVLVSGYAKERVAAELAGRGVTGFLQKPFSPETLLTRVREALEAAPEP